MARTIRWLLRALYAPPQRKAVPKTEEVDLKVLEDQIWDAIEWLSEWHPKKDDDDNQAQEWIDWLDEVSTPQGLSQMEIPASTNTASIRRVST